MEKTIHIDVGHLRRVSKGAIKFIVRFPPFAGWQREKKTLARVVNRQRMRPGMLLDHYFGILDSFFLLQFWTIFLITRFGP